MSRRPRRRLLRPAVAIPALVVLSLVAGIAYAAWTQLDAGRLDANERLIESLPLPPGAEQQERLIRSSAGGSIPVPDSVVTNVLFSPPPGATQADVVAFYVDALTPEWTAETVTVALGEEGQDPAVVSTAFRVDFSRGDDCIRLLTYGMVPGHVGDESYAISAESGQGPCEDL